MMIRFRNNIFIVFFLNEVQNIQVAQVTKKGWPQDPTFGISQNGSPTVKVGSTDAIKGLLVWNACGRDRGKTFADDVFAFSCGYSNMGCGCGRVLVYMELGYIYIQYTYRYGSISIYVWMYAYGYSTYGMYYYGTVLSSWYQCLQRLSSFIICVYNLHIICILTASSSTMNLLEIFQVKTLSCCRRTFCGAGKRWQEQRPRSNTRSPFRCPGERRGWKMDEANVSLLISNDGECHFLGTRGTPRCKKVTEHRYVCFDSKRLDRKEGKEDYSGK